MLVYLACACGKQVPVNEGAACSFCTCECGRSIKVPSLGELRQRVTAGEAPFFPVQAPAPSHPALNASLKLLQFGCVSIVLLFGIALTFAAFARVVPLNPKFGILVIFLGFALLGAVLADGSRRETQLERAFRLNVESKIKKYREWSNCFSFTEGQARVYVGPELTEIRDIPIAEIEHQIDSYQWRGFNVDWTEHKGRLYLRVWQVGGPEPAWDKVFRETSV